MLYHLYEPVVAALVCILQWLSEDDARQTMGYILDKNYCCYNEIYNCIVEKSVENKILEHSPENWCPLFVLYKIALAKANFLHAQLKICLHWWEGEC